MFILIVCIVVSRYSLAPCPPCFQGGQFYVTLTNGMSDLQKKFFVKDKKFFCKSFLTPFLSGADVSA